MPLPIRSRDKSQPLKQASFPLQLAYHAPNAWFKIIQTALIIPNLPAPLHYFNFRVMMGQINIPVFKNRNVAQDSRLDSVSLISSVSPHMLGQLNHYSIEQDCVLKNDYFQFAEQVYLSGQFPEFHLYRDDPELSVDLKIVTHPVISYFSKMKLGLYSHWSLLCQCQGEIFYKGQVFHIDQMGSFEYTRAINFPYLPFCFYTYQVIHLKDQRQLLLLQIRNLFNQIVQSKIYLRDLARGRSECFEQDVYFKVHRIYPKVETPNHQSMYLPREFEWQWSHGQRSIQIFAQSRGDFKFGLGAGFTGSFNYQIEIDQQYEEGSAGYCEYIDCRPLKWQEKNHHEMLLDQLAHPYPATFKNNK